jgi:hypothetical protein
MSLMYDVVKSPLWANMIVENGVSMSRLGYMPTAEELQRIRTMNIGRKHSAEVNAKKVRSGEQNGMYGVSRMGSDAPRFGIKMSDEGKAKTSAKMKARIPVTCPHCNKSCDPTNAVKHHFDNCKTLLSEEEKAQRLMLGRVCCIKTKRVFDRMNWVQFIRKNPAGYPLEPSR